MSNIVITKKDNQVTIAADSLSSIGSLNVLPEYKVNSRKIYQVKNSFIALVGWSAISDIVEDLIRNHLDLLDFSNRETIFGTLKNIQQLLETEYHINTSEDDEQPVNSSQIDGLAISPEGIFGFSSYRNVNEYSKFWAMGSGRDYALGAMFHAYNAGHSSQEVAKAGVECACVFDDSCSLPIELETIELK